LRRLARFADDRPILFSVLVTLAFVVLLVVVAVASRLLPGETGLELGGTLGRLLMAALALWALASLGWLRPAGLAGPGSAAAWLGVLPPFVYLVTVYPLLLTGDLALQLEEPVLASLVAANGFSAGVMEEIVFRGLVLCALIRHWEGHWRTGRAGIVKALVLSSLLFSAPHALNLLTDADPTRVLAQLAWAALLGAVLGMLVLAGESLWPVAALHGLGNAVVHLNRLGREVELGAGSAVLLALAPIPLLLYGWLLLRRRRFSGSRYQAPSGTLP
jgi:membrane protease YdiL (CAAX protease family)